ncbi:glycosyltransferase [Chloroflexus sp.]|uniref:glycosyltransferase n=1 Tax=Chloroflexus sp. TaxID=1904827 RepID=UPI002ADE3F15|nr:glycosyltransferase [Chloroflexus sp.]
MRILMITYGSRGDVQPFIALGAALYRAGHTPVLAAPARFASLAADHHITFLSLPGNVEVLARQIADESRQQPLRLIGIISRFALPLGVEVARRIQEAARSADMIVHSFLTVALGHLYATQYGLPECAVDLFPFFDPPADIANIAWPTDRIGLTGRRFSHLFAHTIFRYTQSLSYRILHRRAPDIGPSCLPWAKPGHQFGLLQAYSAALVPSGSAPLTVQTGSWWLESTNWQPPPDLQAFLADGPSPVVISFGSMATYDAPHMTRIILETLQRTRQRGIIQRGWAGLTPHQVPDPIYLADEMPHDWLLPQAVAMIHHGGAGTTASALRAGIPSVIVPFAADQPFWAWRAHKTGANPPPIPVSALSVERLSLALQQALDPVHRARAAMVSGRMRAEGGVAVAVQRIEQWAA